MTEKGAEILRQLRDGKKLYECKGVGNTTTTYKLEKKVVHPSTIKAINEFLMRGHSSKTSSGWVTELSIKD